MADKGKSILSVIGATALPLSGGIAGSLSTSDSFTDWYPKIKKPSWTPPSWAFGPVWTTLYTMMGIASWLVFWKKRDNKPGRFALALYGAQLVANWIWTPIFFGLRAPGWALAEIVIMWGLIAATVVQFFRVDRVAGAMMVPYQVWVTIATALNATVWWLNRPGAKK